MLWRNTLSRVILQHLLWRPTALCSDKITSALRKNQASQEISEAAESLCLQPRPAPAVLVEGPCSRACAGLSGLWVRWKSCMLGNNRIMASEMALWLSDPHLSLCRWGHLIPCPTAGCGTILPAGLFNSPSRFHSTPPFCLVFWFLPCFRLELGCVLCLTGSAL